jgi:hypothetical protein
MFSPVRFGQASAARIFQRHGSRACITPFVHGPLGTGHERSGRHRTMRLQDPGMLSSKQRVVSGRRRRLAGDDDTLLTPHGTGRTFQSDRANDEHHSNRAKDFTPPSGAAFMHTFVISDPVDRKNPFEELSRTTLLMFHGTHSMFCPLVEQQGFRFDGFEAAYGQYVRGIVAACTELYVGPNGLAEAKGFSSKRKVYFSASFTSARGYALNIGCERIDGALRAAAWFLAFVRDSHRVQLQAAHWEQILKQHGSHLETEQVLANLRNSDLLCKLTEQVEKAHSVLHLATSQGFPVVYAVCADRKWIGGDDPAAAGCHREPFGGISFPEVSADQLAARVDFPNGIAPKSE